MGTFIDSELDGKPSTPADRDDIDGVDDEDGVVFSPTTLVPGSQAQVTIQRTLSGKLDAWIDYDRNGVFDHPTERFLGATMTLSSGSGNVYSFTVPNAGLG